MDIFDLSGRRALITGSSQGIGLALARGLAAAGAAVVLNGRDEAKLAAASAMIPGSRTLPFDTPLNAALVADPAFCQLLEKRTPAGRWGRVEKLVGDCMFLASAASSFLNGKVLCVDGCITASL